MDRRNILSLLIITTLGVTLLPSNAVAQQAAPHRKSFRVGWDFMKHTGV